ncbi:Transcriptional activator [Coemansia interrupta]|uniref:Transcriptional activator HAP2 n=1 Tax=Coemansia interrupta TaxID=1126814 RepID=A0A9W8H895_9FUNG|nr:Transcriptional activator [Coemansia interrupta]
MNPPFHDFHNYALPVADPSSNPMDYTQQYSSELAGHGLIISQDEGSTALPAAAAAAAAVSMVGSTAPLMLGGFGDASSAAAVAAAAAAAVASVPGGSILDDMSDDGVHTPGSNAAARLSVGSSDMSVGNGNGTAAFDPTAAAVAAMSASNAPRDEEPMYVNAKQYHRILKRRDARARMAAEHKMNVKRKPYLHESRHKHAMRRPRGPGGRFLTASEIAEMERKGELPPGTSEAFQTSSKPKNKNKAKQATKSDADSSKSQRDPSAQSSEARPSL